MKQRDIGFLIKQIHDKMKTSADASLKDSGMTLSQARVVEFLQEQGGQVTQKEIENYLQVAHPTVVGIVSRLESKGFLHCSADENDRRNKIVQMTDQATESTERMYQGRAEAESQLLRSLSVQEVEELRRMLQILYENLG